MDWCHRMKTKFQHILPMYGLIKKEDTIYQQPLP
jgi:hypothetical protein